MSPPWWGVMVDNKWGWLFFLPSHFHSFSLSPNVCGLPEARQSVWFSLYSTLVLKYSQYLVLRLEVPDCRHADCSPAWLRRRKCSIVGECDQQSWVRCWMDQVSGRYPKCWCAHSSLLLVVSATARFTADIYHHRNSWCPVLAISAIVSLSFPKVVSWNRSDSI